jgi:large subunit ribosomal protein L28
MSRRCQLTGKKSQRANNVSHSNQKTNRRQNANLQSKRIFVPELGRAISLRLSTRAMKTMNKKGGLFAFMKELKQDGVKIV